jgi:hypothetical protein
VQAFDDLRTKKTIYADKTEYFTLLQKGRKVVFCVRPRRFGKSLTVTVLDAFFSGLKELFQGLAAEEFMNPPKFTPKPVIHLDMSEGHGCYSQEILERAIKKNCLEVNAKKHKVALGGAYAATDFSSLLKDVNEAASQKIVLLIDEYDAPIISLIQRQLTSDPRLVEQT